MKEQCVLAHAQSSNLIVVPSSKAKSNSPTEYRYNFFFLSSEGNFVRGWSGAGRDTQQNPGGHPPRLILPSDEDPPTRFHPRTGGNREISLSAFLIIFDRPRGTSSEGSSKPGIRPFVPRTIKKQKTAVSFVCIASKTITRSQRTFE